MSRSKVLHAPIRAFALPAWFALLEQYGVCPSRQLRRLRTQPGTCLRVSCMHGLLSSSSVVFVLSYTCLDSVTELQVRKFRVSGYYGTHAYITWNASQGHTPYMPRFVRMRFPPGLLYSSSVMFVLSDICLECVHQLELTKPVRLRP